MNFRKFRKFKKNAKALSPVIATIILIAVTVAVSVVVAAWMGALTIGFMGNAEQASITNAVYVNSTAVNITVQNTGSAKVTINSVTIDGNATTTNPATPFNVAKGTSATVTIAFSGANDQFTNSAQYTIKLQTAKGNTNAYTYTYSGP